MGIVNIRLDLASCVITSIVVGIGVDFALHYLFRLREVRALFPEEPPRTAAARAVQQSGAPILYDVVSNVIAFGIFLASPLLPIRHFGALICVSMFACAAATLLLLPRWAASRTAPADASTLDGGRVQTCPRTS